MVGRRWDVKKKKLTPLQRARLELAAQVLPFFAREDIKGLLAEDARSQSTPASRAPVSERVRVALANLPPETLLLPRKEFVARVNDWLKRKTQKPASAAQVMRASGRWHHREASPPSAYAPSHPRSILELAKQLIKAEERTTVDTEPQTRRGMLEPSKLEIARQAVKKAYPGGVPKDESNSAIIRRVVQRLKRDFEWPKDDARQPFSYDTILRAADRRR
jgi:hypothetical protein